MISKFHFWVIFIITVISLSPAFCVELPATQPASDKSPPSVPSYLVASEVTESSFTLDWRGSRDDESDIQLYKIYVDGKLRSATERTYKKLLGLSPGKHKVSVSAVNGADIESKKSSELLVQLPAVAVQPGKNHRPAIRFENGQLIVGLPEINKFWLIWQDLAGKKLFSEQKTGVLGKNTYEPPHHLKNGVYFVRIVQAGNSTGIRLTIGN